MPGKVTIGTVRFLNAWPLTFGLEGRDDVGLRAEAPSALAPLLRTGEVDVALLPSIEYFRMAAEGPERARGGAGGGYVALPVAAIGSRGPIGSVRLFGYAEPAKLRRVHLDPASRTSNALAEILVVRRLKAWPHFTVPLEGAPPPARPPDAELIVGDRALSAERPGARWVLDLGQEWEGYVHRPFIYAFWVARAGAPLEWLIEVLSAARDRGLAARDELAVRGAKAVGIPVEAARRYLTEQVEYEFGPKQHQGLRAFYRMASEDGLAPDGVRLHLARAGGPSG